MFVVSFFNFTNNNYPIERNIEEPKDTNQVIQSSTEKNNIDSLLCVLCMHPLRGSSIVFRVFFLFFSISLSLFLYHSLFNHTPRYTMKRHAIDLPIDFAVTFFCRLKFSSDRVEPCLQSFSKSFSKSIVGENASRLRARRKSMDDQAWRDRDTGKERTNEEETNETNGFFGILFPRWIAVFIRRLGSNSRREMS